MIVDECEHRVDLAGDHFGRGYGGPKYSERRYDLRIKEQYERVAGAPKK
jgi:hypothetical protein